MKISLNLIIILTSFDKIKNLDLSKPKTLLTQLSI
jgi:hypothetical protein